MLYVAITAVLALTFRAPPPRASLADDSTTLRERVLQAVRQQDVSATSGMVVPTGAEPADDAMAVRERVMQAVRQDVTATGKLVPTQFAAPAATEIFWQTVETPAATPA